MRVLALGGVVGPVLFSLVVLYSATLRPEYSHITNFISELGASGTSHASLMNYGGFLPGGILLAGFGLSLRRFLPPSRSTLAASFLTTVFGVGIALSGLISCDPGCPQVGGTTENFIHDKIAPVSFLCLIAATAILSVQFRSLPTWRSLSVYSGVTSLVAFLLLVTLVGSLETRDLTGLWQRLMLGTFFLWTAVVGLRAFRGEPLVDDTSVPEPMRDAWHIDVHRGSLPALLEPSEMVAAVFNIGIEALAKGDVVQTPFGKFYTDEVASEPERRFALLHTWAPGSTARFALEARRTDSGPCEAVLYNSVHPTSWFGKLYFRAIQPGHNIVMHVALRRLAHAAVLGTKPTSGAPHGA